MSWHVWILIDACVQFRAVWDIKNVAVDGEQVSPVSVVAAVPYPRELRRKSSSLWTKKADENSILVILGISMKWTANKSLSHQLHCWAAELTRLFQKGSATGFCNSLPPSPLQYPHQSKSYTATLWLNLHSQHWQTTVFWRSNLSKLHIILEGKALREMICSWLFLLHLARTQGTSKLQAVTV